MSADWGGLMPDPAVRDIEAGPQPRPRRERPGDAGAWPEDIDVEFYADTSMTLPGQGEPGENCGTWFPREFCDECGEPQFGRSRCEQRVCPSCWSAWARRRSEKIARRLGAARYAAEKGLERRAIHAVVSPPPGEVRTLTGVQEMQRDAYALAREKGVRGGVTVFHGYRVTERGKELYSEAVEAGEWEPDVDGRLWSFVRRHPRGWRALTYWSPHVHILGLAEDFEADDPDEQDGWIAWRVRTLKPFKLRDSDGYEDMVGASMYLLSHAAFDSNTSKDCVRWFGDLATTKFSPEGELSEGALSVVERLARDAAEAAPERGDSGGGDETEPCENCGSTSLSPIWEAGAALMDAGWCQRIERRQENRLRVAFEWCIGDLDPPPGMKNPRTETEAKEAFEAML